MERSPRRSRSRSFSPRKRRRDSPDYTRGGTDDRGRRSPPPGPPPERGGSPPRGRGPPRYDDFRGGGYDRRDPPPYKRIRRDDYGGPPRDWDPGYDDYRGRGPPPGYDRGPPPYGPPPDRYGPPPDRYDDRYGPRGPPDFYDGPPRGDFPYRGRGGPPMRGGPGRGGPRDEPMTYKEFLLTQDDNITPAEAERRYGEYQAELGRRDSRRFFVDRRGDEFMREKYDPEYLERARAERAERARAARESFAARLAAGAAFAFDYDGPLAASALKPARPPPRPQAGGRGEAAGSAGGGRGEGGGGGGGPEEAGPYTVEVPELPPHVPRAELRAALEACGRLLQLRLGAPVKARGWSRTALATFEERAGMEAALAALPGKELKGFALTAAPYRWPPTDASAPVLQELKVAPSVASEAGRVEKDLATARRLVAALDGEAGLAPLEELGAGPGEGKAALDRLLAYLREVHCFCLYCGEQFEDPGELLVGCGRQHVRKVKAGFGESLEGEAAAGQSPWERRVDEGAEARIKRVEADSAAAARRAAAEERCAPPARPPARPRAARSGGASYPRGRTAVEGFCGENTKMVEAEKYRCVQCTKLFKGPEFVGKHIRNKHEDKINELKAKLREDAAAEAYLADPRRLLPSGLPNDPDAAPRPERPERPERPAHRDFVPAATASSAAPAATAAGRRRLPRGGGGFRGGRGGRGPPALGGPIPPRGPADPRAGRQRDYVDLDNLAEGDVAPLSLSFGGAP
eukprot:tig00001214_g7547.t1